MKIQRKTIEYGGMATTPDDYVCQDGQLALSQNMIAENGGLETLGEATVTFPYPNGDVVYIHKNPD